MQHFNVDHFNTLRALDFHKTNTNKIPYKSMCIMPHVNEEAKANDANIDKESDDQVSPNF